MTERKRCVQVVAVLVVVVVCPVSKQTYSITTARIQKIINVLRCSSFAAFVFRVIVSNFFLTKRIGKSKGNIRILGDEQMLTFFCFDASSRSVFFYTWIRFFLFSQNVNYSIGLEIHVFWNVSMREDETLWLVNFGWDQFLAHFR